MHKEHKSNTETNTKKEKVSKLELFQLLSFTLFRFKTSFSLFQLYRTDKKEFGGSLCHHFSTVLIGNREEGQEKRKEAKRKKRRVEN